MAAPATTRSIPSVSTGESLATAGGAVSQGMSTQLNRLRTALNDWDTFITGGASQVPSCRVYNSANISINNATITPLTFNSERWDTDTLHSTSSNTGRITVTRAGRYAFGCSIAFASNATGYRWIAFRLNGTTTYFGGDLRNAANGSSTEFCLGGVEWVMAATDYVEVVAYQTSTAALNVITTATSILTPEFWCEYRGP